MAKKTRILKNQAQKDIAKLMEALCGKYSIWEVWQDFIVLTAVSLANVFDGPYRTRREDLYLSTASKYSSEELESFAHMAAILMDDMTRAPDQDFLGDLFMGLGLNSEWKGQFFTPYHVCVAMAKITMGSDLKNQVDERGWISVNDPACGAGALLLAFAQECLRQDINYQQSVLFVAQDIDFLASMMCYIQLSLMGCPGYVVIGNSITEPVVGIDDNCLIPKENENIWYTPMYYTGVWQVRRVIAMSQILRHSNTREAEGTGEGKG